MKNFSKHNLVIVLPLSYLINLFDMDNTQKTSLILHGHFYQPPRENPFTGIIEKQVSAAPYMDWNERIYHDCYEANAHSRYLSPSSRIVSLTNNYSYISFNFGHTLLSWLQQYHPAIHEMIMQADRESIARLGHGNAMAQSFNHTILPLDTIEDARLQISWGIDDFISRYKRDPEGMWLPEAAINENVIDLLAEAGIKFVVLSPWQCRAVENPDTHQMEELSGKPAPYYQSYILTGAKGKTISAFFYHPGLAEGISFGHALRNADELYNTILNIKNSENRPLIHTATDGEIYGHHEPFGDMALAALIKKVEERNDFHFTNYASYLADHPSTLHAVLHKGEDGKGTSWSCSHGVSRWYKDCGCHTGGEENWNQAWRTGLRNALANLGYKLDRIFADEVRKIFSSKVNPYDLLREAGCTLCGAVAMPDFINELHKKYKFSEEYNSQISSMLSGIMNKHFSLTSCGFFFSELSGIEPRQNIKYAIYSIRMFQPYINEDLMISFLSDLRLAKSNIKSQGDGMSIAQEEMKGLSGETEAAIFFYLNRLLALPSDWQDTYGRFSLEHDYFDGDENYVEVLSDKVSMKSFSFTVLASSPIESGMNLYICEGDNASSATGRYRITNDDIPLRMLDDSYEWIDRAISDLPLSEIRDMTNCLKHYSMLSKNNQYLPMKTQMIENLGLSLKIIKGLFNSFLDELDDSELYENMNALLNFINKCGRNYEKDAIKSVFSAALIKLSSKIQAKGLSEAYANQILNILTQSRNQGFEPELRDIQNVIYSYYTGEKKCEVDDMKLRKVYDILNFQ